MGDYLKKVQTGDALRIPAAAYNAFIDTALDLRARQQSQGRTPQATTRSSGIILVKNASGADQARFAVLGIDGPLFTPTASLDSFKNQVALVGVTPTASTPRGRFVVLAEPLKAGAIGQAYASGVCPVKVDVVHASHRHADLKPGSTATLKSGPVGAAQILWQEAGTGDQWALVRLGVAPAAGTLLAVKITKTGGAAGDKLNPCSFLYTARDLADQVLGTGLTPAKARPPLGALVPGTGIGLGYFGLDGTFVLYDANETLDTEACG